MTYSDKLKSPKWQKKRLEVLNRDNFKCCLCSDEETELHIHHLKYTKEPWDAPISDLQTLCRDCHIVVEQNKEDLIVFGKKWDNGYITYKDATGCVHVFWRDNDNVIHSIIAFFPKSPFLTYLHNLSNE